MYPIYNAMDLEYFSLLNSIEVKPVTFDSVAR